MPATVLVDRVPPVLTRPEVAVVRPVRVASTELSEATVSRLEPLVRAAVDDVLDAMHAAGSPGDLVTQFARPLPTTVLCYLLGVPYRDHGFFHAEAEAGRFETLRTYLAGLVESRRAERRELNRAGRPRTARTRSRLALGLRTGDLISLQLSVLPAADLVELAMHQVTRAGDPAELLEAGAMLVARSPEHQARLRTDPGHAAALAEQVLATARPGLGRPLVRTVVRVGLTELANRLHGLKPLREPFIVYGFERLPVSWR